MRRLPWFLALVAVTCACVVPLRTPDPGEVAPLRAAPAPLCPELGVWLESDDAPAWVRERYEAQVVRALRTSGLFTRVVPGAAAAPLQAVVRLHPPEGPGLLPFWILLSITRVELGLELELRDVEGRTLFEHHGERGWTLVATALWPFGPSVEPSPSVAHGLVRAALERALAEGVFAPWGLR